MKFGVCAGIDALPTAAEAGCDYLEMGFATVAALPDEAFREVLDKVEASPIRVEAMNGFLPGTMRLTGPEADHEQPLPFITKGFSRAKALGAQVVVFGSGGARSVPEGFPMEAAKEQMAAFARKAAACAREAGIRLALEPLSRHECNFLHTVKEGLEIYHMAGEPEGLCVLADLYHMASNGEDFSGILEAGPLLAHCHIAAPESRVYCMPGQADELYQGFFAALRAIGYTGRISLEGHCEDMRRELAPSVAYLRSLA